jgi:hypothetical protein
LRHLPIASLVVLLLGTSVLATPARADEATDKARSHYETGLELFYAREHAQALIEFQRAHEVKPRPATLFMMGQCEYLLGSLRQARDHYEAYLRDSPTGEFVEVAKDRVESINRRPATLVINTVPDQVDVRITPADPDGPGARIEMVAPSGARRSSSSLPGAALSERASVITGQAPNNFSVSRGRWLIALSKATYQSQAITVEVEVAENKPLFFKLEPIPARLEVETFPSSATLYVNGSLSKNPYRQNIAPGHIELVAQAPDYADRTQDFVLGPGDRRLLVGPNAFQLRYQRSGRPELLVASIAMGALIGAGALAGTIAAANEVDPTNVAAASLMLGGALAGGIGGALLGNRFVPSYIPDNRALFVIGGMWIGVAEGAMTGMFVNQLFEPKVAPSASDGSQLPLGAYAQRPRLSFQLKAAFFGSLPGIVVGTTAAALLSNHAPNYGRVALIQSAAVAGALVGGLAAVALRWRVFNWEKVTKTIDPGTGAPIDGTARIEASDASILDLSLPALIGLNVGLGAGLLGAYLPDQSRYGPSWTRIALIDLAAGAGALGLGIAACVADDKGCLTAKPDSMVRARTAGAALLGGAAGLVAGILLTRNVDAVRVPRAEAPPSIAILPIPTPGGVAPMVSALGFF